MDQAPNAVETAAIRAAGGLVWRDAPRGRELAVVRRTRHGDGEEWTLPKGKLESGEAWPQAALREVKEETGCEVRLDAFAGCNAYTANGQQKLVLFWNMTMLFEGNRSDRDEVKELRWLTPQEAVGCLTHVGEKGVLIGSGALEGGNRFLTPSRNMRLKSLWKRIWFPASAQRLEESLTSYSIELEHLIKLAEHKKMRDARDQKTEDEFWAPAAIALLYEARASLKEGNEGRGWHCLLAAQRMELWGLQAANPAALQLRGETIRHEALDKLKSWRKERVEGLLGDGCADDPAETGPAEIASPTASRGSASDAKPPKHEVPKVGKPPAPAPPPKTRRPLSLEAICEAAQILHSHFHNKAVKERAGRKQMRLLISIALAAVGVWLALLLGYPQLRSELLSEPEISSPGLTATVLLFGLMGAALSGILSTSNDPGKVKIPDLLFSFRVTLARLVVGILSALTVNVMLTSEFLKIGKLEPSVPVILLAALAAGFSERLVAGALNKVAGDKD